MVRCRLLPLRPLMLTFCAGLLGLLGACTTSSRNLPEARRISLEDGYRDRHIGRSPGAEPALRKTYVILAFSGGGTRAAALAQGVLRELEATPARDSPSLNLLHAVDMISSTSGGSVAAANFVLRGPEGFGALHQPHGFLHHDGMADLAGQILNPLNVANFALSRASRIEALPEMLRRQVFGDATFRTLRERAPMRAPLLLLNSADMRTGLRFTFTQEQLDRLCLDLREIPLADAVAASAAFPVALTPLPLPVHSPCRAQTEERRLEPAGIVAGFDRRARLREALAASRQGCDAPPPAERHVLFGATAHDQPDLSNALRQWHYLNRDACGRELPERMRLRFVHLQDGGTADNLALGAPLEAATGGEAGSMLGQAIRDGRVREIIFVGVNARSQGRGPGRDGGTPGVPAMLLASINTPIDSRSGGLAAQLHALEPVLHRAYDDRPACSPSNRLACADTSRLPRVRTLRVDFELIADAECRAAFQDIATSWTLPPHEVVALQEMASAMLRSNPEYLALTSGPRDPRVGLARARAACDRMREHSGAPPTFGG